MATILAISLGIFVSFLIILCDQRYRRKVIEEQRQAYLHKEQ